MSDASTLFPWLETPLAQALTGARGHALLVHGARGVGQFDLALAIAAAWLCEASTADQAAGRPACRRCASCLLIAARTHPDLKVAIPAALQESLGWVAGDEAEGEGAKSKAKPSKEIKVDAVRATVDFAQQTSARGKGKVAVFHPAERMNPSSANMLLKTLEEPPGDTRFLLVTSAAQRLLPTVRSRCQALAVPLPPADVAAQWLSAQGIDQPGVVLAAAGGAPLEALERLQLGIDAKAWLGLPRELLTGSTAVVSGWPVPLVIDALQKLCHDLASAAAGAAPRFFPASSLPVGGGIAQLAACARQLAEAARHAEHPWNAGLACEALVQRVALAAAGGGPAAPALTTLNR